jgi:Exopolysaccharide biosynthesis protein YbjH
VRVVFEGATNETSAQSIGRIARALTGILPNSVEDFVIVPMVNGMAVSQVTLQRSDMEQLEYAFDGSWSSFTNAQIEPVDVKTPPVEKLFPRSDFGLGPYLQTAWFDPDQPLRADLGVEAVGRYEPTSGVVFFGVLRKPLIGNLDQSTRVSDSVLPHVRSDSNIYDAEGDPALTELTGAYYFQPRQDVFGRVTAGYLERMFGGISAEALWKPTNRRFGLGAEFNYVQQRDYNQLLGFQDYRVATGHVSGYWEFDNGLHTQIDVGRYLAGDWGATFIADREFKNGWRIGAFATLTNVSAEDFGEGSFDKGIRLTIPIGWVTGAPTRDYYRTTIRPVTRDGGAKLDVTGRLYETVRGLQKTGLRNSWGRFWR